MIDLAELEAKARAATQGEWDVFENLGQDEAWCDWHRVGPFNMTGGKASADDLFIQASRPSIVLELIERVRAAEAKAGEPRWWASENEYGFADLYSTEQRAEKAAQALTPAGEFYPLYAAPPDVSALQKRVRVLEEALGKIESACLSEDDGSDEIVEIVFGTATAARKSRWRRQ